MYTQGRSTEALSFSEKALEHSIASYVQEQDQDQEHKKNEQENDDVNNNNNNFGLSSDSYQNQAEMYVFQMGKWDAGTRSDMLICLYVYMLYV